MVAYNACLWHGPLAELCPAVHPDGMAGITVDGTASAAGCIAGGTSMSVAKLVSTPASSAAGMGCSKCSASP